MFYNIYLKLSKSIVLTYIKILSKRVMTIELRIIYLLNTNLLVKNDN